jgi:hypothetical protein
MLPHIRADSKMEIAGQASVRTPRVNPLVALRHD